MGHLLPDSVEPSKDIKSVNDYYKVTIKNLVGFIKNESDYTVYN